MSTGIPAIDWLLIAAGVLTALGVIWTKGVKPVAGLVKTVLEMAKKVDLLVDALRPNGETLLEKVDNLQSGQDNMSQQLEAHLTWVSEYLLPRLGMPKQVPLQTDEEDNHDST